MGFNFAYAPSSSLSQNLDGTVIAVVIVNSTDDSRQILEECFKKRQPSSVPHTEVSRNKEHKTNLSTICKPFSVYFSSQEAILLRPPIAKIVLAETPKSYL